MLKDWSENGMLLFDKAGSSKLKSTKSSRSSGSSRISLKYLQQTADELCRQQRCEATRRTYHYGWCNFSDFLISLDQWPDNWDDRIVLFAAQLIVEGRPEQTVKSYVSAVKAILKEDRKMGWKLIIIQSFYCLSWGHASKPLKAVGRYICQYSCL